MYLLLQRLLLLLTTNITTTTNTTTNTTTTSTNNRLSMHIQPEKGILFLILPSRCINSKHVGRMNHFIDLLHGFNLVEVLPRRITPKLIFFILKYKEMNINNNGTTSRSNSS